MENTAGGDAKPAPIEPHPPGESIAPAFQASSSKVKKKSKASRQQVAVACLPCQKRKCRCDGKRPVCSTCVTRGKTCEYNIDEGFSRVAHLKVKNKNLEENSKSLAAIVELLRKGSDSEAAAALARLRVGHSIASIVQDSTTSSTGIEHQASNSQDPAGPEHGVEQVIPSHLKVNKLFDRVQVWGHPTQTSQAAGSNSFTPSQLAIRSSPPRQTSRFQASAATNRQNTGVIPHTGRQTATLSIEYPDAIPVDDTRLRNFGNMDFSSGILANNYPINIQRRQMNNFLSTPMWAKMTIPINLPNDHPMKQMNDVLVQTYTNFRQLLDNGASLLDVAGAHPRLAAILDDREFVRAPPLSQWASQMVFSIKETNTLFVCYASMYLFWWLMRWMIHPSPETYFSIPEFLRPSPTQLFMPHLLPLEFFAWPGLRDYLVNVPEKFMQREWMFDMSLNIACACPLDRDKIMAPSPIDGELELTPEALGYASSVENWSMKPNFRQYFLDCDRYITIRWDD